MGYCVNDASLYTGTYTNGNRRAVFIRRHLDGYPFNSMGQAGYTSAAAYFMGLVVYQDEKFNSTL